MLVMFVIRGMALSPSFPKVKDMKIINSLKGIIGDMEQHIGYKLGKYPELSRDRSICNMIITVLRDHDNDKSIPLFKSTSNSCYVEAISDGSSSSDEDSPPYRVQVESMNDD